MENQRNLQIWSIVNAIILIGVIVINALASILPLNGMDTGQLSDLYPNLFVPAGLTFSVWGVIYLLLISFAVYGVYAAFRKNEPSAFIHKIGPWFLISSLANIGWIFSWHWKQVLLSLFFMVVILLSLMALYVRQKKDLSASSAKTTFLTVVPFSVYLGWITVATIANISAVLVNAGWLGEPLSEAFWTVTVIIAAVIINGLMLLFQRDWGFAAVGVWALLGIVIKRSNAGDAPAIVTTAAAGMAIIIAIAILRKAGIIKKLK